MWLAKYAALLSLVLKVLLLLLVFLNDVIFSLGAVVL